MLKVICSISLLLGSVLLSACGQSGALQLASDPNHDKRAKYLLYKNKATAVDASANAVEAAQPASATWTLTAPASCAG